MTHPNLLVLSKEIRRIEQQIDDILWGEPYEKVQHLENELDHLYKLREKGEVYLPRF